MSSAGPDSRSAAAPLTFAAEAAAPSTPSSPTESTDPTEAADAPLRTTLNSRPGLSLEPVSCSWV